MNAPVVPPQQFFKPGAVVYFKKCLRRPTQKADGMSVRGYAFGVLLGVVPPFAPDPPAEHVLRLMGTAGYVSFDDVIELLGKEAGDELIAKYTKKYYGEQVAEPTPTTEHDDPKADYRPPLQPAPKLLGADGKPLVTQ